MDEKEQPLGYLQTTQLNDDDDMKCDQSKTETDILAKYQEAHIRRQKSNQKTHQQPTKRGGYGETTYHHNSSRLTTNHPSCLRESLYLLFAWFGYFIHITFALIPYHWFHGKMTVNDFYSNYTIEIGPANWNIVQWGIQILWQGILLTYLSLIIAEHTIKIFGKGFYYGLGLANICLAIWDICTQQQSYLGRAISWLSIEFCLIWTNYIILKHIYYTYDVTKYVLPSRFRLDSITNDDDDNNNNNNDNVPNNNDHIITPPNITPNNMNMNEAPNMNTSTTSRNINAILRIQSGSLNNSPISMSMAPSAAEKLVYEAAMAAGTHDNDWLETKIKDLTQVKYCGLIGIVFNGTSYFLSVVMLNFWVQVGVWLVYECNMPDKYASVAALIMMFITILIYYYFDFYYFEKYFVDNFATHIVFVITFAAMVWKHLFGDHHDLSYSFCVILEIIIFCIVIIIAIFKVFKSIKIHRKYKMDSIDNDDNNQYQRVIH